MSIKESIKPLIKDCARQHGIKGSELIAKFKIAQKSIAPASTFANLLKPETKTVEDYERYSFVYHCINLFFKHEVQTFNGLNFQSKNEEPDEDESEGDATEASKSVIVWNSQQRQALKRVFKWLRSSDRKQIFRLFGWAGTGKTELSKEISNFVREESGKRNVPKGGVLFAAYTGKAGSVMRVKGCKGADTLHSLLYKPLIDEETGKCSGWTINQESPLATCGLLIIDEVSMVNELMAKDILGFGCPVLVLGDPEQLPPIEGIGFFIDADPDIMMTDVERQSKDNPILYLAHRARRGLSIKPGKYGDSVVYDTDTYYGEDLLASHDQILCGMNNTRTTLNKKCRRIQGYSALDPMYPVQGERLICLKNNKVKGLYNGTLWTVNTEVTQGKILRPIRKFSRQLVEGSLEVLKMGIKSIDETDDQGRPYEIDVQISRHHFNSSLPIPDYKLLQGSDDFFYGSCITVHKSQGSQWDSVLIKDESQVFRDMRSRHRYTALTRASKRLSLLL